jgi:hypothetical protein
MLVCAAGPLDTGQLLTYLYILLLPVIVLNLIRLTYPTKFVVKMITKSAPWHLRGRPRAIPRTRVKRYKTPERKLQNKNKNLRGATMRTYLFPALFTAFKVGCHVEAFLRQFSGPLCSHLAFQSKQTPSTLPVRFNSDSFLIGVNSHTSRCMVNDTHLFEDLRLTENNGQVSGIVDGLAIKGEGTFKFDITDNDGKRHTIKIKNSLYVPKIRRCLLSPQHWAQEAKNEETWIEFKREFPYGCILNWKGGKKTIPNQPSTKVPVFYTTSSSLRYCPFAATFEAMEASFFRREQVLQYPGQRDLMDDI